MHKEPKDNPPGRPIISGNGTLTEPATKYIDYFLKPLVRKLPSFIEDTTDVLNKIQALRNIKDQFLVTMDVESLYTNIEHQEGLFALRHFLTESDIPATSHDFLFRLTEWVIHNNIFIFMDELYIQKIGVPMGSCFSPNYACLFLGLWEKYYVLSPANPFYHKITWYGRYIDDILLVFDGNVNELLDCHKYLNSINPNIKLSMEYSMSSINFLDLTIFKDEGDQLHTTLYRKSTSRNTILRADSFHPQHLKRNIPYGQFQRLRRICNCDVDFDQQAEDMSCRFLERAYKPTIVKRACDKAQSLNRDTLLTKTKKLNPTTQFRSMFVTTYSTCAEKIKIIIRDSWPVLESDPVLSTVFPEPPLFSFRHSPNLRDKLMHSYLPPATKNMWLRKPTGTFKCMNCPHCYNVNQTKTFTDVHNNKTFKQLDFINCNTTFVIYRLSCPCPEGFFYVGRTKRRLRDRLAEHKYAIRVRNQDYPMARHFMQHHNDNDSLLRIEGIEHVKQLARGGDRLLKLNQREAFWIHKLKACELPGLNEDFDLTCFL